MVTPGVSGRPRRLRWVAVAQALLWSAIGLGAFLLLAERVPNTGAEVDHQNPGPHADDGSRVLHARGEQEVDAQPNVAPQQGPGECAPRATSRAPSYDG